MNPQFLVLLQHLYRGGKYAHFWHNKISRWFAVDQIPDLPSNWHSDVYFSVNPSCFRRAEYEKIHNVDVCALNCLYFEIDCSATVTKAHSLARIAAWPIQPACIIDSGGGLHGYLLLRQPYLIATDAHRSHARTLQKAFTTWAMADAPVHDIARILRVPGTLNTKPQYAPNFPTVEIVQFDLSLQYDLADIETILADIVQTLHKAHTPAAATNHAGTVSLDDHKILEVLFRSKNGATYERLYNGDTSICGGDHSKADQMLCNGLCWVTGGDSGRMDSLFRQSALYRPKWDRKDYSSRTIDNAISSATQFYTGVQVDQDAIDAAQSAVGIGPQPSVNGAGPQATGSGTPLPSIDQILLNEGANDEGNAQCVWRVYGHEFAYCDAYGYLRYNGKFWELDGAESALQSAIVDILQRRAILAIQNTRDALLRAAKPTATNVRNCAYLLKRLLHLPVSLFDADADKLNCNNGVVDLRTGYIEAHSSSQLYTYCVPVDYNSQADYVQWLEFLYAVTAPEIVDYLQMAVGYSLTGHTREEKLFYLYGPTRSGKGTFAETLLTLLPKPLGVQADFGTFTTDRVGDTQNFDLAPLKPARLVIASESNKYDTLNEAKVKSATGGDWIRCAYKHRDHFEYRPQFKIWLLSNHPVKGDVDDDAFWGRVKVIEFLTSFLGREDKTLKQRMKAIANLEGVLAWAVAGAIRWYAAPQGLEEPQTVIDATGARRNELDYIQQWIDDSCTVDPSAWTANTPLYNSYKDWCKDNGIMAKGAEQFARSLTRKGFIVGMRKRVNNKQIKGVQGLLLIP